MVNRTLLSIKLAELADRAGQVRRHRKSVAELKQDRDAAELVAFKLLLAVQACVDIASHCIADEGWPVAKSIGESFTRLEQHGVILAFTFPLHHEGADGLERGALLLQRAIARKREEKG